MQSWRNPWSFDIGTDFNFAAKWTWWLNDPKMPYPVLCCTGLLLFNCTFRQRLFDLALVYWLRVSETVPQLQAWGCMDFEVLFLSWVIVILFEVVILLTVSPSSTNIWCLEHIRCTWLQSIWGLYLTFGVDLGWRLVLSFCSLCATFMAKVVIC